MLKGNNLSVSKRNIIAIFSPKVDQPIHVSQRHTVTKMGIRIQGEIRTSLLNYVTQTL